MLGRSARGNSDAWWALTWLSVTSPAIHKQVWPFWCWFPGGWVYVRSRILWVSPMNSPVRLGASLTATAPTDFYSQRFWGFISLCWNPRLCGLSRSPVVPPRLSEHKRGTARSTSRHLATSPLCPGCPSPPLLLVWMNVSLTPQLSDFHQLIFWRLWLFFVFKFVVVLLLVVWRGTVCLPTPLSWPEVSTCFYCQCLKIKHNKALEGRLKVVS